MRIKVIGIGGIGCALLPVLARFLNFRNEAIDITLIDGDNFEEKNQDRQVFTELDNKAEATAKRVRDEFQNILFLSRRSYVTEDTVTSVIKEGDIVFLCVDNHATRELVSDWCEDLDNVLLISGGNNYNSGNVQIFERRSGENATNSLTKHHPEIANPLDKNPGELGCDEKVESKPQLVITNNLVAAVMLSVFYSWLQDVDMWDEIYINALTSEMNSIQRR